MHIKEGEKILKIYHHHPTPFVLDVLKVIAAFFPFYLALFSLQNNLSTKTYIISHLVVFFVFVLVMIYISLAFWLDRLIITDRRVIHIDYKTLTMRDDSAVDYDDVADIQTKEKGLLAHFWIFDYGTIIIDTASSYIALTFKDAPDPEEIRRFIYQVKPQ